MKKTALTIATLLLCITLFAQENIKSIDIGTKMPMAKTKMISVDDRQMSLSDAMTENGLLVMFSCNTCPYVVKSEARTKEMVSYAMEKGFGVIIINSNEAKRDGDDSRKAMAKYAKKQAYEAPYVVDENSQLADAFGATRTPEVFLFDGNGALMYKGAMEDNPAEPANSKDMFLRDAIDKVLTGAVPDPNSTKSIGCTIKRVS